MTNTQKECKQVTMERKKYTPLTLANAFIQKAGRDNGIEHMKVQKLAYFAYGWWLALKNEPLLSESPQVWKYGPVFNSLYHSLSHFKGDRIKEPQKKSPFEEKIETIEDEEVIKLIDWIWDRYSRYTAIELSDMTHSKGTPWREVAEESRFVVPRNFEIPQDKIMAFFKKEAEELGI